MPSLILPDTSTLILDAVDTLYGDADDWMELMASDLQVRIDTIRQWAHGRHTPSRAVLQQLAALLDDRVARTERYRRRLDQALPRMLRPSCGATFVVVYGDAGRRIRYGNGHHFQEEPGPPFGPHVEKRFIRASGSLDDIRNDQR